MKITNIITSAYWFVDETDMQIESAVLRVVETLHNSRSCCRATRECEVLKS